MKYVTKLTSSTGFLAKSQLANGYSELNIPNGYSKGENSRRGIPLENKLCVTN